MAGAGAAEWACRAFERREICVRTLPPPLNGTAVRGTKSSRQCSLPSFLTYLLYAVLDETRRPSPVCNFIRTLLLPCPLRPRHASLVTKFLSAVLAALVRRETCGSRTLHAVRSEQSPRAAAAGLEVSPRPDGGLRAAGRCAAVDRRAARRDHQEPGDGRLRLGVLLPRLHRGARVLREDVQQELRADVLRRGHRSARHARHQHDPHPGG